MIPRVTTGIRRAPDATPCSSGTGGGLVLAVHPLLGCSGAACDVPNSVLGISSRESLLSGAFQQVSPMSFLLPTGGDSLPELRG